MIAMPVFQAGTLRSIVLYGARVTGDGLTNEEVQLLRMVSAAAGPAHERLEMLALRSRIGELQAGASASAPG